jgi:outer membrane receptor for ferric coprogen and ferric-rhodotorulic acid
MLGANWADRANYYDVRALYQAPFNAVDIFNYDPYAAPEPATPPMTAAHQQDTEQSGIYGTVRLHLTDSLHAIVGGRLGEWEFLQRNMTTGARVTSYRDQSFMPYGGIVHDLNQTWSLYASYADIFEPQNAFDYSNRQLDPTIGATYETGIKGEVAEGKLAVALAVFHMVRDNVSYSDPLHPGPTECNGRPCSIDIGKQESQGAELEISGSLTPRWNLFTAYTYNTTEYVRDSRLQGQPLASWTPEHIFRLWSNYVLPVAGDRLSLGGGVSAQTKFYRILNAGAVTMTQPGYTLLDARVGYQIDDRWSLALNGHNLLDKKYYSRMNLVDQGSVYGEPRNVVLSLQGRF